MKSKFVLLVFGLALLGSCLEKPESEIINKELVSIEEYFDQNDTTGWNVEESTSGLFYRIHEKGDGDSATISDIVVSDVSIIDFQGNVLYDSEFRGEWHTSLDATSFLTLGMKEAYQLINVGGRITAYMPSELAYGSAGLLAEGILPNEDFAMVIEHVRIKQSIIDYIAEHELDAHPVNGQLYYVVEEPGEGDNPTDGDEVTVHYTGTLLDGTEFDSSVGGNPISFVIGSGTVIEGWDWGIPLFKKGGKGILLIPHQMGYGSQPVGDIPPYEALRFDIEIVDIQ